MKLTSVKSFIDSNVLIYAHTDADLRKQKMAQDLIINGSVVSTQVLQETANVLTKKFHLSWNDVMIILNEITVNSQIHRNTERTVLNACAIAARYKFSFFDSLIITAAQESDCNILYSEDLSNDQVIGNLRVLNPFSKTA